MSCCNSDTLLITPVPGPQGPAGAAGTNGTNGVNAYTTTITQFTMPAEGATVVVNVSASSWATLGQIVVVAAGGAFGYFQVTAKPASTQITLKNIEDTASGLYAINSAPGTIFVTGASISPAGIQGPAGSPAAGALLAVNNLSDVNSAATSRINLGLDIGVDVQAQDATLQSLSALGTAADRIAYTTGVDTWAETALTAFGRSLIDDANAAASQTTLGLVIGTNVQAQDAGLQSLSALPPVADRIAYSTAADTWAETALTSFARTLLDDTDATTARATLGVTTSDWLVFNQTEASNTDGGTFTSASWQTVPLNTEVVDTGSHGSIAASQITLDAGTYRFRFGVVGYKVNTFQGRLYNVTDAGAISNTYGTVSSADSAGAGGAISLGVGRFTLATSKTIRLEAYCQTTEASDGFGNASNFGGPEVYSYLELTKE